MINKTQLDLTKAEERQLVHRDYLAHCLRWSHILRNADIGETILDLGCADAPLAMAFYTNKFKPKLYVGVDIRSSLIEKNRQLKFNFPVEFITANLITEIDKIPVNRYTIVAMLEVLERVEKKDGLVILNNVLKVMNDDTVLYLSTPCFNGSKAGNHVYEWRWDELRKELEPRFLIQHVYGTFASQKDIKDELNDHERYVFERLYDYYDSNLLSILFAPLHPSTSRNCLWVLKKKQLL